MYSLSLQNCLIICFSFISETSLSLFGFFVFGCLVGFFSETKSKPTSQWVYRVTQQNSRKMMEAKYPVKKKVQPSLALYSRNRCNFVLTAVSILENKSLTTIF